MTLPSGGVIAVSDVSQELGQAPTWPDNLSFMNSAIYPNIRPGNPNMAAFYGYTYFQRNTEGNCDNGNCTNNCNCGNIQCNNCVISGPINCTNCDSQPWLQNNCNCACTYNCTTAETSYNCNCACNCSKIVCAKLYEFGHMDKNIWAADQQYGKLLRKTDRRVYRGYIRWARTVTAWMDGKGPDFMIWVPKNKRPQAQKEAMTNMALRLGTPWSKHMAYLMGELKNDNLHGRVLMSIGRPISKLIDYMPHTRGHSLTRLYIMWTLFWVSHWAASTIDSIYKNKPNFLLGFQNEKIK